MKRKWRIILGLAVLFSALCIGMALAETSGNLNTSISWTLSNTGILRSTGEGAIPDYSRVYTSSPFEGNTDIKDVRIGSGITHIGSFLFYGCSNLLNLEIPQSVVSIGQ